MPGHLAGANGAGPTKCIDKLTTFGAGAEEVIYDAASFSAALVAVTAAELVSLVGEVVLAGATVAPLK